jgi:hypothetical protein
LYSELVSAGRFRKTFPLGEGDLLDLRFQREVSCIQQPGRLTHPPVGFD